jgi:hypothetical protein
MESIFDSLVFYSSMHEDIKYNSRQPLSTMGATDASKRKQSLAEYGLITLTPSSQPVSCQCKEWM